MWLKLVFLFDHIRARLTTYILPLILLIMRLWMAKIFGLAGLIKLSNWQTTLSLFEYEYKIPIISPTLAAYMAAATELTCPILLTLGFATRFACLPMLMMAITIQLTYLNMVDHIYWMMLLSMLITLGAGPLSLDYLINKKLNGPLIRNGK